MRQCANLCYRQGPTLGIGSKKLLHPVKDENARIDNVLEALLWLSGEIDQRLGYF